jgi:hypothetical protein
MGLPHNTSHPNHHDDPGSEEVSILSSSRSSIMPPSMVNKGLSKWKWNYNFVMVCWKEKQASC